MYKLTVEFKTKEELQAYLGQGVQVIREVAADPAPVETKVPTAVAEAKEKRKGSLKPKAVEAAPVVVEEEDEVETVEINREAILTEAREVCGALITSAAGNEAGAIKARILGIIKTHGGDGKMSSIIHDEKLMDALQDLKKFAVEKLDKDESFV